MLVGSQVDPWTRSPHTHTYRENKSVSSRSQTIPTQTFIISSTNKFVPITGLVMGIIELQTTQKTGWTMTKTNSQEYLLKFLSNRIPRVDETYVSWGVDKRPLCWSFELSPWSVDRCFKMYCYSPFYCYGAKNKFNQQEKSSQVFHLCFIYVSPFTFAAQIICELKTFVNQLVFSFFANETNNN